MDLSHPRAHILERDYEKRGSGPRYRAQIVDLTVGDTLADFGRILEHEEVQREAGFRMFRIRTERPAQWPVKTSVFTVPEYVYYGVTELTA